MDTFSVRDWHNAPTTDTPLSASAIEDLELRLSDYSKQLLSSAGTQAAFGVTSTTVNTVDSRLLLKPSAVDENALTIKAPSSAWGESQPYGKGQALELLKASSSSTDIGRSGVTPDDFVLARMDNRGGWGLQGIHVATGLRQEAGWTGPYAVRMTPYIDTPILQMYPQLGTTLAVAIPDGTSTSAITVGSTSAYPTAGTISLLNSSTGAVTEKVSYTGKTQTTLTGITRGVSGTTGVAHATTEAIQLVQTSNYLQGWTPGAYQETFRITPTGTGVFGQGPVGTHAGKGMAIGDVGSGSTGYFGVGHSDRMNSTDYALMQGANGDTYINSAAGQVLSMRIGNRALFLMAQTSDAANSVSNPTAFNISLGYIQGAEINDPTAPGVNAGRLYFRDNGSGKTQLCVRMNTGAIGVLYTEP